MENNTPEMEKESSELNWFERYVVKEFTRISDVQKETNLKLDRLTRNFYVLQGKLIAIASIISISASILFNPNVVNLLTKLFQ